MENSHLCSGNSTNCPDAAGDASWILTSSFIIFTMQSGFGLLEAGKVKTVIFYTNVWQDLLCSSSKAPQVTPGSHIVVIVLSIGNHKQAQEKFIVRICIFVGLF